MEKRKTLLMVILCLVLAAIVATAAILGVSLSRSAFSDTDNAYAGEARWRMTCEITTADGGLRPSYEPYEGVARSRRCFVPVGTLRNEGDLDARVSLTAIDDVLLESVTDRDTGYADDLLFSDEEITEHFRVLVMYWSYAEGLASADDGAVMFSGQAGGFGEDPVIKPYSDGGADIYVYADITWTTDLEEDVSDEWYDGSLGDEFDEWAGRHLLGLIIHVDLKAEQAE